MQSHERDKKKRTVKNVLSWYWNFTQLPGFTQCRDTDTLLSKGFWFILAIVGWIFTGISTYSTIASFLQHEILTKTQFDTGTVFKTKLTFPSVTICNSNRVHCDHLYHLIHECEKVYSFTLVSIFFVLLTA